MATLPNILQSDHFSRYYPTVVSYMLSNHIHIVVSIRAIANLVPLYISQMMFRPVSRHRLKVVQDIW
jgi:hypothetical protein